MHRYVIFFIPYFILTLQALVDIVALWGSIVATMVVFHPINGTAALLLLPHLGWVSFATYINLEYLRLNGKRPEAINKNQ